jgi:hypothetical protein
MTGFVPVIRRGTIAGTDGRDKPGHDGRGDSDGDGNGDGNDTGET